MDLARITLHLRPTHHDTIPSWTGRAAQALFLETLRSIDPALSAAIHDGSGLKPFTTSGLQPAPLGELLHLAPTTTYTLNVSTLHADLTRLTLNTFVDRWKDTVRIHDQILRVQNIEVDHTTYTELLNRPAITSPRRLAFNFITPTVFKRSGDLQIPLPLPENVFGSLIDRWSAFTSGPQLHPELKSWVLAHLSLAAHNIHTIPISFERAGKGTMVGFVGSVDFHANQNEAPFLPQLHALRAFAAYAGIGAKTTVGLGHVSL